MPFVIHLFFDEETETKIKGVWKTLADSGISPYMHQSANRPHLTLAIYEEIDLEACQQRLQSFSTTQSRLPVVFQNFGIFPTNPSVVFIGPTVSVSLLILHQKIHQILNPFGKNPNPYYLPSKWIPHCTLALDLEPGAVPPALELGQQISLPIWGEISEIGGIEFRPVTHLFGFRFKMGN